MFFKLLSCTCPERTKIRKTMNKILTHSSLIFLVGTGISSWFLSERSNSPSFSKASYRLYFDLSLNKTIAAAWTGLSPLLNWSIMFSNTSSSILIESLTSFRLEIILLTCSFLLIYFGVSLSRFCLCF